MARRRNKGEERAIVHKRIDTLFAAARKEALGPDDDLSDRYAQLSMRVARRYQAGLGPNKHAMCRSCKTYRRPATSRTRIHRARIVTTCLTCGEVRRRPL
jgi:ribonuclease P protein subunit RPR2